MPLEFWQQPINKCLDCKAIRQYPDGKILDKCPRCKSTNLKVIEGPKTKEESDKLLLDAIKGVEI